MVNGYAFIIFFTFNMLYLFQMRAEEEARRLEEVQRKEQQQQQYLNERKRLEAQLHSNHLANVKSTLPTPPPLNNSKKGQLIDGRTQFFEQKVAELNTQNGKPFTKPKNFKYQV